MDPIRNIIKVRVNNQDYLYQYENAWDKEKQRSYSKHRITVGKLVDGTLARGTDVEKYVAIGADCTLAGRHFVRAAHGGLADGVALFANKMKNELAVAMVLTGAQTVKDINRSMVVIPDYKA
jgi:isopentenyl diphosphate isomerase/L-lactate dehydrogenase-like FMN-dependent dehydrogenase